MTTKCVKISCPPARHVSCSFHILQSACGRIQQYCSIWLNGESVALWLGLGTKTTLLDLGRHSHGLASEKAHTGHPVFDPSNHSASSICRLCRALNYWQMTKNVVQTRNIFPIEIHYFESLAGCHDKHWQFLSVYTNLEITFHYYFTKCRDTGLDWQASCWQLASSLSLFVWLSLRGSAASAELH